MSETPHRPSRTAVPASLYGGGRVSAARRAIATALGTIDAAFTVEDLHAAVLATQAGIGVATVYRAVGAMAATGSVAPVGTRDGSTLYARCAGGSHHHHLVCTGCGAVVGIACPVDSALLHSAEKAGYTVTAHEVTLYGLCSTCAKERA